MTPPNAIATRYASHSGRSRVLMRDQAIRAPSAPTAPYARLSTPVARNRTTIPTPDSANTPPSARPSTRYGRRSGMRQGGAGPPFQNPPSVRDVRGASGAALRVREQGGRTREDQLNHRAEPMLVATMGFLQ